MVLNELALFAGGGGGILASKLLGWNTIGAVEIEDYPRRVLLQRQRDGILEPFPIWDDVNTFDGKPWKGLVDILSGAFLAKTFQQPGKVPVSATESVLDCGKSIHESLEKLGLSLSLRRIPRFYPVEEWTSFSPIFPDWGIMQSGGCWELGHSVLSTNVIESGYLPTPTKFDAVMLGKGHPTRTGTETTLAQNMCGDLNPVWVEWLMDWPMQWTDLKPLEMDKFQSWLQLHFRS